MFLEPLAPEDARELIEALLRAAGAEVDLPGALAERCGGNPLFAEAMVQRIAEDGEGTAAELPDTVQGLLAARLDSLEPFERQLVAHAAVLGRTFWESALEPVARRRRGAARGGARDASREGHPGPRRGRGPRRGA